MLFIYDLFSHRVSIYLTISAEPFYKGILRWCALSGITSKVERLYRATRPTPTLIRRFPSIT